MGQYSQSSCVGLQRLRIRAFRAPFVDDAQVAVSLPLICRWDAHVSALRFMFTAAFKVSYEVHVVRATPHYLEGGR